MGNCGAKVDASSVPPSASTKANEDILHDLLSLVYSAGNTFEAVRLILQDSVGRNSFRKYLKSEYAAEGLLFYEEVELFKYAEATNIANVAKSICDNYLLPGSSNEVNISDNMKSTLLSHLTNSSRLFDEKVSIVADLAVAQREVVAILAMNGFPRYVSSPAFKSWTFDELQLAKSIHPHTISATPVNFASNAYRSMEDSEFQILCQGSAWMKQFIAVAELLPVSVCVSTASQHRRGFPLIYVNPEFSMMTGFAREEIIGKNCKFLQQASKSERDSISQMATALQSHSTLRIDVTNFKKDGTFFRNLVCFKPILDQLDEFRYVICFQLDITGEGLSQKVAKFADSLLAMIPSKVNMPPE